MRVKCDGCGRFHVVSPTAMIIIIDAFQEGKLQTVTGKGVVNMCLGDALQPDAVSAKTRKDSKTVVSFDGNRWQGRKAA